MKYPDAAGRHEGVLAEGNGDMKQLPARKCASEQRRRDAESRFKMRARLSESHHPGKQCLQHIVDATIYLKQYQRCNIEDRLYLYDADAIQTGAEDGKLRGCKLHDMLSPSLLDQESYTPELDTKTLLKMRTQYNLSHLPAPILRFTLSLATP
jgi:hypothetical protein